MSAEFEDKVIFDRPKEEVAVDLLKELVEEIRELKAELKKVTKKAPAA